jgi:8-oxo-dGTP diphosphatase
MESRELFSNNEKKDFRITSDSYLSKDAFDWLTDIYNHTDWRCVTKDGDIENEYKGIPVTNIFKALVLPYLINIPYERNLWSVLVKNKSLQALCGVICQEKKMEIEKSNQQTTLSGSIKVSGLHEKRVIHNILQERTFWHFRKKYQDIFATKIIKILISIVLDDNEPNLSLPFVKKISTFDDSPERVIIEWKPEGFRPPVLISIAENLDDPDYKKEKEKQKKWELDWQERLRTCNDFTLYKELVIQREKEKIRFRRNKIGFLKQINFPIYIKTNLSKEEDFIFELFAPTWQEEKFYINFSHSYYMNSDVNIKRVNYDKACNMLVIREINGIREILLSQRKKEDVGKGKYAIPGGKQKQGESLEACAYRELKEETNLEIVKSRPVSLFYTRRKFVDGKQIMSVGVLVEEWTGELKTMEPDKHIEWKWFPFDNIPHPLFDFTEIALNQYLEGKYAGLTWDDVEEKAEIQLHIGYKT